MEATLITDRAEMSLASQGWRRAIGICLVAIALYDAIYLVTWLAHARSPRFGDFFALWTFGSFVISHPPGAIYDQAALQSFQIGFDPAFKGAYPFLYPPSFLLVVVPLALVPLGPAWLGWCTGTTALHVAAVLGRGWRSRAGAALVVAPTTLLCIIAGQSGLLTSALTLGGLRLLPARPWLGGALLGLLTVKPQLGVLLPVALLAAGQFRAIAAAGVTVIAVVTATWLAFGWDVWTIWANNIRFTMDLIQRNRAAVADIAPTISAGLFQLGVPDSWIRMIQLAAAIAAGFATWRAFRPGITAPAIAVLAMATFLVTPYGYIYDLPVVTGALVLVVLARAPERREAMLFCLIALAPLAMLGHQLPLVEPALLAAGIIVIGRRAADL